MQNYRTELVQLHDVTGFFNNPPVSDSGLMTSDFILVIPDFGESYGYSS